MRYINITLVDGNCYVFCMRRVACVVDVETKGVYGFHFVTESGTEEKVEDLHFIKVECEFAFQFYELPAQPGRCGEASSFTGVIGACPYKKESCP